MLGQKVNAHGSVCCGLEPSLYRMPKSWRSFSAVGVPGISAVELARQILKKFGSLRALAQAPLSALLEIKGLKGVKAAQLVTAMEFYRRVGQTLHPRCVHGLEAYRSKVTGPSSHRRGVCV